MFSESVMFSKGKFAKKQNKQKKFTGGLLWGGGFGI